MSIFKNTIKNINGPEYNYLDHMKYPVDFPVKSDGSISSATMYNDIDAMIYYINTLIFSTDKQQVYSPYKTINTMQGPIQKKKWRDVGGTLGNKYDIILGKCKNGKPKKLHINNKTGFTDWSLLGIPDNAFGRGGFNGLVPGIMQGVNDINPYQIFEMASGKSKLIECFKNNKSINIIGVIFIILVIFFIIYSYSS